MKKTGSYSSWVACGILTEIVLLALLKQDILAPRSAWLMIGVGILFFFVRFLIDWRIFNNRFQKYVKWLITTNAMGFQLYFGFVLAALVALINYPLGINAAKLLVFGFASVTSVHVIFEGLRQTTNSLKKSGVATKNSSKEVKANEQTQ
jgi:hypothetical protein